MQGVLPGCPIAMCLLQLVMFRPFDVHQASIASIPRTLDIYADDITLHILMPIEDNIVHAVAAVDRLAV
eukprot:4811562-Pyramimonas_sp.AAC.1